MIHRENRNQCSGCSACADACPHKAIRMAPDGMGFLYPAVDRDLCVDCGICDRVCAFRPADGTAGEAFATSPSGSRSTWTGARAGGWAMP